LADTVKDNLIPTQQKARAEEKLTAILPGMNRFQWDLRYPDAVEVTGFEAPIAAGGEDDSVDGPVALPGHYRVVLDYAGHKTEQAFEIALDPRLHPARGALEAQFKLQMQIHDALDSLDQTLNQAIGLRDQLNAALDKHTLSGQKVTDAVAQLTLAIGNLVQLEIQGSEGDLLHDTKLRSHLAYLASDVGLAYEQPTAAQYEVFKELDAQARNGIRQLQDAIADGKKVL
jgi:hypothetical protein